MNFYRCGQHSTMGGHRDDLELTMDAPVVSMSFGSTAVFLLGVCLPGCKQWVLALQPTCSLWLQAETRNWRHRHPS